MAKYIGNLKNIIDWNNVIDTIKDMPPAYIGPRHTKDDPIIGINEITKLWDNAGYKFSADGGSLGWDMFFPGQHFDKSVVDKFSEFVNIDPISSWISRTNPGMMAPWHWDANDSEEEYLKMPEILRFSCHISISAPGHVFVVDGNYFYNQEQGNVYQWNSRQSWHAGMNFGYTPKYLFNIFGTAR